jgi:DNA (cytosine-5)-methyltransferase 1
MPKIKTYLQYKRTSKPLLLDLFCGAGGAAKGYMDAGFYVVGVDINPQPHYIGNEFYQDDALYVLGTLATGGCWNGYTLKQFDAVHESPECKGYSNCNLSPKDKYEKLIAPTRRLLQKTGKPYVIENVMGAKRYMQASLMLCGSMFDLPMQRHRLFEFGNMDLWIRPPKPCDHRKATIGVYGHSIWDSAIEGTRRKDGKRRPDSVPLSVGRSAMGIDWMGIEELAEAIPPAYTQWIGEQLLAFTSQREEVKA